MRRRTASHFSHRRAGDDLRATVVAAAEAFAHGELGAVDLGFSSISPNEIALARRRRKVWMRAITGVPHKFWRETVSRFHFEVADEVAALGPAHAAFIAHQREMFARAIVMVVINARVFRHKSYEDTFAAWVKYAEDGWHKRVDLLPTNFEMLLAEATGHGALSYQAPIEQAIRAITSASWRVVGRGRPEPPIAFLHEGYHSPWAARFAPFADPAARLEFYSEPLAAAFAAVDHPRLGRGADILWDPCISVAAAGARAMCPAFAGFVSHEVIHAADDYEVEGDWIDGADGIPGIVARTGFARFWISAESLGDDSTSEVGICPWPIVNALYEGWTTARAKLITQRIVVDDLQIPDVSVFEDILFGADDYAYTEPTRVLERLLSPDEILGLPAMDVMPTVLTRLADRLPPHLVTGLDVASHLQIDANSVGSNFPDDLDHTFDTDRDLPDGTREAAIGLFRAALDAEGSGGWEIVLGWLDEAESEPLR